MVTNLLRLIGAVLRFVTGRSVVLELAGVACLAAWAADVWGASAVLFVAGVALLAKSLELDLSEGAE